MGLKVELKPGERIIIGGMVVSVIGDQRARLSIEGKGPVMRESEIMTPETADTAAKLIYLSVQLMYLDQDIGKQKEVFFSLVEEFLAAVPSAKPLVAKIGNHILSDDLYKALRAANRLIQYERELLTHAERNERLRENGVDDAIPS